MFAVLTHIGALNHVLDVLDGAHAVDNTFNGMGALHAGHTMAGAILDQVTDHIGGFELVQHHASMFDFDSMTSLSHHMGAAQSSDMASLEDYGARSQVDGDPRVLLVQGYARMDGRWIQPYRRGVRG